MITVVMNKTRLGENGTQWRAGDTYSASEAFAKALIGAGDAYAADGSLPDVALTAAELGALRKKIARSNVLSRCPMGNVQASTTAFGGYCTHIEAELAGRPIGIQVGVPNLIATTQTIAARFAFGTALGTLNTDSSRAPSLTYTAITWAGSATGTLPAGAASRPGWLWSDVMPCSAPDRSDGSGSVVHMELRTGTSGTDEQTWFNGLYAATTTTEAVIPRKWRGYRSSASAALGSATFSANAVAGHIAVVIRYVCMTTGATLLTIGESHDAGTTVAAVANSGGVTYADYAAVQLNAAGIVTEHCNLGWGGQDAPTYTNRLQDIAADHKGVILLYAASSSNSMDAPIIAANIEEQRGALGRALKLAQDNDMLPILRASIPSNASVAGGGSGGASAKNYAAGDPLRVAYDAELAASDAIVWRPASVLSGAAVPSGTAAGQIEFVQAYTTDGFHSNDAGYLAGSAVLLAALQLVVA